MRGGRRPGAGRPPKAALPERHQRSKGTKPNAEDRASAGRILEALNRPESPGDSNEVRQWRALSEANDLRIRLDVRKYLYDKRDGKAVQPMEFGDKPLSVVIDLPSAVTRRGAEVNELYPRAGSSEPD